MSTDTKIKTLIFNKLTQEQYNNADRVPTEFYFTPDTSIDSSEKGAANGVASLDTNGKVPVLQLPANTVQQISSTNLPNASTMAFQFAYLSDKSMLVFSNGVSWKEVVTTDLV